VSESDLAVLTDAGAATVYEAAGQCGAVAPGIRALTTSATVGGRALTIRCQPGDNLAIHRAVAEARPGDVMVIDGGEVLVGYIGDILAEAAQVQGVVGAVIDGGARDLATIAQLDFPVWARGPAIRAASKRHPGAVHEPVVCGGVAISSGDWVIADGDGVVAVAAAELPDVAPKVQRRLADESRIRQGLQRGELTVDLLGLRQLLAAT
jgi:4-hydroxy-4-methyl-2-oxoglutarate aldolase